MANHTSPIDVIILASDGYYAMVRSAPSPSTACQGPATHAVGAASM